MIETLAQWMIGEFTNRTQALEDPVWYVHLQLWHRPVQLPVLGDYCIFAEQANILHPETPYRQRLLVLHQDQAGQIQGQYWAFRSPEAFRGAGAHPQKLRGITRDQILELPGCKLTLDCSDQSFSARPLPHHPCCFDYAGQTRQVEIGFEVRPQRFTSYDRGIDPQTGKAIWGALMGPYQFDKCQAYSWNP
ncbi:chromophore lyase CpcT/CpeT [Lyngbya confervoides]|uniref:Chromophore lyase CpcT/CpeT n=1 Tax=Lyngbya confervoides BDU141951 TaxID=1574623 RepID=A0ABD4T8P0_9CYAN|nr:chromophore lyase CpcT/CpeT [Lyngbya confervoides]MCM1985157.1 chromophore lyase CpcT/CpeT [Lyngbya confervoides BDU141951]